MVGPNTGLGHNSIIYMIEAQAHYIVRCMQALKNRRAKCMTVKQTAFDKFNEELARRLDNTVWSSGCRSWYTQADGKNIAIWPGLSRSYRTRTRSVQAQHYDWVQ